jgi:hypothetical protein
MQHMIKIDLKCGRDFIPYVLPGTCGFRFEFDPMGLFYGEIDEFDNADEFERLDGMFSKDKYGKLFNERLKNSFYSYLQSLEHEVELEYEHGCSFETLIRDNEDLIFNLVDKNGPQELAHSSILDMVEEWCQEKKSIKLERLIKALKAFKKSTLGTNRFSYFEKKYFAIIHYDRFRNFIRKLKRDIRENRATMRRVGGAARFVHEWVERRNMTPEETRWLKQLKRAVVRMEGATPEELISYMTANSPRQMVKDILADELHSSDAVVERLIRDRANLRKTMRTFLEKKGHRT